MTTTTREASGKYETFTYFMLVRATPHWLHELTRAQRFEWLEREIKPILGRYPGARLRFYDAEAYTAYCSDVMVWEVTDQAQYRLLIDEMRDTAFFSRPYFEIVNVIPAMENAYQEQDDVKEGPDRSMSLYDPAS